MSEFIEPTVKVFLKQDHLGQKIAYLRRRSGSYRYVILKTGEIELLDDDVVEIPDWVLAVFEENEYRLTDWGIEDGGNQYISMKHGDDCCSFDGGLSLELADALVWWMRNIK